MNSWGMREREGWQDCAVANRSTGKVSWSGASLAGLRGLTGLEGSEKVYGGKSSVLGG